MRTPSNGIAPVEAEPRGRHSSEALTKIAAGLSALSAHIANGARQNDRTQFANLNSAMAELRLLRGALSRRLAADDRRAESLKRIDAALCELANALEALERAAQKPISVLQGRQRNERVQAALRRTALILSFSTAGVGVTGFSVPAAADTLGPTYIGMTSQDDGVMSRARPEYDAKGVPLGGFRLFPSMDVNGFYDDNVYLQPSGNPADVADFRFEETPSVRIQSQWGRHFLEVYGGLDNVNYAKYSKLDLTDWDVGTDGRYDISRSSDLSAAVSYGEYHEVLSSPSANATPATLNFPESPNRYYKTHAETTGRFQPNRLGFSAGVSYDRYDWLNTPTLGGGTLFNTDRNEDEYQGFARVNYDFSPGYSAYVKGLYDSRQFDLHLDRTGVDRSSHGFRVDAGLTLQLSHLVVGDIFIGYLDHTYKAPLKNVSGLDYGIGLDWFATPVLTVHLAGARTLNDVTLNGVSASDEKSIKLSADYEFRRNIILKGYVSYTDSRLGSYLVGTTRDDTYPTAGIGVRYMMNRYMSADFNYNYNERSSNFAGVSYTDNTVSLGLSLHI